MIIIRRKRSNIEEEIKPSMYEGVMGYFDFGFLIWIYRLYQGW